ncbi:MAG: THxN family PEP-CTERM protein [Gammaproteobacteria bacterium]|nr:THxN family PEP-CTERM protein [Gammaproteobacteria bacterium]MBU1980528.1 THxN family PEP-CTERM protein [Gammaproteobacteria bacterium]
MSSHPYGSSPTQCKIAAGLVSLVLFGATQLSQAASITLQNTTGAWTAYTLAPEALYTIVNNVYVNDGGAHASSFVNMNGLSWGESPISGGPQSGLIFNQTSNGSSVELGAMFELGTLTHSNQLIYTDTSITNANLQLKLTLTGTGSVTTGPFDYNFSIFESLNSGSCPTWQASMIPCDDKISFSSAPMSQQFSLDGQLYWFNLLGFSKDRATISSGMITTEQMATTQYLMANITAVPVPAALWLLGSGLLGLAGFARRKRAV